MMLTMMARRTAALCSLATRSFAHGGKVARTNRDIKVMKHLRKVEKFSYNKRLYKKDDATMMEIPSF